MTTDNAGNAFIVGADHRPRRQHRSRPAAVTAPARRRERPRHDRTHEQLRRRGLGRRDDAVPALAGGRRHLDEPGRELEHDAPGRRPLRPPRRDHRQRRQLVHLRLRSRFASTTRPRPAASRRPPNGAEIGVAPVALTSNSADGGSGVATVVFERSPAGAGSWSPTPASWDTASGPDAVADGELRPARQDDRQRRQLVHVRGRHGPGRPHGADDLGVASRRASPSNAPVTVTLHARATARGSGVSADLVLDRRRQRAAGQRPRSSPHRATTRTTARTWSSSSRPTTSATSRRRKTVTVVIDTTAPSGAPGDPGTYLRGIANLTYSTGAGDVSSVQFQFSPAGAGAWSNIGAADISPPYERRLEHDARRRRPVRPARRRHRHHRQRRRTSSCPACRRRSTTPLRPASSPRLPRRRSSPAQST